MAIGDGEESHQSFLMTASLLREMIREELPATDPNRNRPAPIPTRVIRTLPNLTFPTANQQPEPVRTAPVAAPAQPTPVIPTAAIRSAPSNRFQKASIPSSTVPTKSKSPGNWAARDPSVVQVRNIQEGARKSRRREQLNDLIRESRVTRQDLSIFSGKQPTCSFADPKIRKTMNELDSVPQSVQDSLLAPSLRKKTMTPAHPAVSSPADCYKRINQSSRKILKNAPLEALADIEDQIIAFLRKEPDYDFCDFEITNKNDLGFDFCDVDTPQRKTSSHLSLYIPDSFLRMRTHALCEYYGIQSRSQDVEGRRMTTISKPRSKNPSLPSSRLVDFLRSH